jgi:hypothetical protein
MRARAYVSVQGASFNAGDFQLKAGERVRRKKHSGAPFANHPLEDWTSAEKPIEPCDIDAGLWTRSADFLLMPDCDSCAAHRVPALLSSTQH